MKIITFIRKITPKWLKRGVILIISLPFFIIFILRRGFVYIRWFSSDINVFYHTFILDEFFVSPKLENITNIIDAGANSGLTALYFHYKFPLAKIIAIEPEQSNFDLLVKNTQNYGAIFPIKCGVWYKDAYLKISNPNAPSWSYVTQEVDKENCDIKAVSLPTICKKYNIATIDLLKIDIEGSEKELFKTNINSWLPKTRYIVMEFHGTDIEIMINQKLDNYNFIPIYVNGENHFYKNTGLN